MLESVKLEGAATRFEGRGKQSKTNSTFLDGVSILVLPFQNPTAKKTSCAAYSFDICGQRWRVRGESCQRSVIEVRNKTDGLGALELEGSLSLVS